MRRPSPADAQSYPLPDACYTPNLLAPPWGGGSLTSTLNDAIDEAMFRDIDGDIESRAEWLAEDGQHCTHPHGSLSASTSMAAFVCAGLVPPGLRRRRS